MKPSVCGETTQEFMSDFLFVVLGTIFMVAAIMNSIVFIYFSENIRLNNSKRMMRRNLLPEIAMGWMFLFYFFVEDLKENSFVQLAIPMIGYMSMIYLTLKIGSFTSEN
jgi:CDP-diglyceride synthetase